MMYFNYSSFISSATEIPSPSASFLISDSKETVLLSGCSLAQIPEMKSAARMTLTPAVLIFMASPFKYRSVDFMSVNIIR